MAWSETHLWIALAAPVVAIFVARAAYAFEITPGSGEAERIDLRIGALAVVALLLGALSAPSTLKAAETVVFLAGLSHLAIIDWRLMVAPVRASLALTALGLAVAWLDAGAEHVLWCAVAACVGWATFRVLDLVYARVRGRSGLGEGDALIAAALGAWLSWDGLAWSVAIGGLVTLIIVWAARRTDRAFPFAPGLAFGALAVVLLRSWG